jgi:DnaJ-class molecular chaperone
MTGLLGSLHAFLASFRRRTEKCNHCGGEGRINHFCGMGACVDDPCPACKGRGKVPLGTPAYFRQSDANF